MPVEAEFWNRSSRLARIIHREGLNPGTTLDAFKVGSSKGSERRGFLPTIQGIATVGQNSLTFSYQEGPLTITSTWVEAEVTAAGVYFSKTSRTIGQFVFNPD